MLHCALVCLDALELKIFGTSNCLGDLYDRAGGSDTATASTAVDFNQNTKVGSIFFAAADKSATLSMSSTQTVTVDPNFGSRARRSIFSGSRTSLVTKISTMPPRAKTSASDTFWQQTPTAPPSSICNRSTSTDLCILPWAR